MINLDKVYFCAHCWHVFLFHTENVFRLLISMWKTAVHLGWSPTKVFLLFPSRVSETPLYSQWVLSFVLCFMGLMYMITNYFHSCLKLAQSKIYFTKANVIHFCPFSYLQSGKVLITEADSHGLA